MWVPAGIQWSKEKPPSGRDNPPRVLLSRYLDSVVKVKEAQTELSTTLTLDALYFGPKTRHAVENLDKALHEAKPWWNLDESTTQALLDATGMSCIWESTRFAGRGAGKYPRPLSCQF
jgi:hypothetical protein